jgi:hypothetical protein
LNLVTDLSYKIILSLKPNLPCPPLSNTITTNLITIKESTINNLIIIKDNIIKHPYSNKTSSIYYNSENI